MLLLLLLSGGTTATLTAPAPAPAKDTVGIRGKQGRGVAAGAAGGTKQESHEEVGQQKPRKLKYGKTSIPSKNPTPAPFPTPCPIDDPHGTECEGHPTKCEVYGTCCGRSGQILETCVCPYEEGAYYTCTLICTDCSRFRRGLNGPREK
mmetsp:Transcript_22129/g.37663  ORF Transcript_22129/g.37663 Transcript_22129/m.37663 type:complete len:149 (-) Transcript_22129:136-582(-)